MLEVHPGQGREGLPQLVALAVVAAEADREDLADPQRDQVIEDRARRAPAGCGPRRRCRPCKPVSIEVSSFGRVDVQIPVEEEIADDPRCAAARSAR